VKDRYNKYNRKAVASFPDIAFIPLKIETSLPRVASNIFCKADRIYRGSAATLSGLQNHSLRLPNVAADAATLGWWVEPLRGYTRPDCNCEYL
jgi:hypothetical protein